MPAGTFARVHVHTQLDVLVYERSVCEDDDGTMSTHSSLATEWVKGMNVDDAVKIKNTEIAKHLSLPPVKLHCSMLAEDAIKAAVKDFKAKRDAKSAAQ